MSFLKWIGGITGSNNVSKSTHTEIKLTNEKFIGFNNFGNTCYCNSILQALYSCKPFRECIQTYTAKDTIVLLSQNEKYKVLFDSPLVLTKKKATTSKNELSSTTSTNSNNSSGSNGNRSEIIRETLKIAKEFEEEDNLLWELKSVFSSLTLYKKKTGSIAPKHFVDILQRENEVFRGTMHQDAQEFLNHLINSISESLSSYQLKIEKKWNQYIEESLKKKSTNEMNVNKTEPTQKSLLNIEDSKKNKFSTWIHELFEGILTNEIKCLTCENVTCRDESFFDLSVDIEHNTSISACLKNFSSSERLCQKNKFYCDTCCGLQEAEKRMKIKLSPNILALHLKRFKYEEKLNKYIKLPYRVLFPTELRLLNMTDKAENPDRLYNLFAITIHIGNGPYHGHYVTVVRGNSTWLMCDDESVEPIDEVLLQSFFGDLNNSRCGYMFFYQAADFDMQSMTTIHKCSSTVKTDNSPEEETNNSNISENGQVENKENKPSPINIKNKNGIKSDENIKA